VVLLVMMAVLTVVVVVMAIAAAVAVEMVLLAHVMAPVEAGPEISSADMAVAMPSGGTVAATLALSFIAWCDGGKSPHLCEGPHVC
jgi:hypothetical protein